MLQIKVFNSPLNNSDKHEKTVNRFLSERGNGIKNVVTNSPYSESRGGIQLVTIVTYEESSNLPPPPLPKPNRLKVIGA